MKDIELIYFDQLKKEIQAEYLKNNTPSNDDISEWKGIDIIYFQEELRKKAKGNISEKTFYTYFKAQNIDKLPRIDMLNLLSSYVGYDSWYEFKKEKSIPQITSAEKEDEILENLHISDTEKPILQNNYIDNQEIDKKTPNNSNRKISTYKTLISLSLITILGLFAIFYDDLFKKSYEFCFTDADRGEKIKNPIDIKIIKENESPIHYKIKAGECFRITTKDKTLRMEVSSPLYEKVEIFRNLEEAPAIENISLKPDDYALMLYYYSTKEINNSSLENIKNKQQKLNNLISENALIYQVFDNEIYGIETLSKQKYIGLVTTPTQSLQNLKVISTKIEKGKIVSIKFKIESNEEK